MDAPFSQPRARGSPSRPHWRTNVSDLIPFLIDVGIPGTIGIVIAQVVLKTIWKPIFQAEDQQRIAEFNQKRDELYVEARKLGMNVR